MTRGVRSERSAVMDRDDPTLTPTMARCLAKLREHGGLIRLAGGYWVPPGAGFANGKPPDSYDIQSTIEGLVRRGLAHVTKRGGYGSKPDAIAPGKAP